MSYNTRMSMVPNSQQNRSKKKEEDSDAFMRLPDKEIVGCISDIGVPFTVADLQTPNPLQIQMIFEWFAELLVNATRETVDPAMRSAAEDICGEYMDIIPPETRNLMGFYVSLRKLLIECGIVDFSFQDLYKPTYDRLAKVFSYIINFVRFRESQTAVIDEHFNKAETTKNRIENLIVENHEMELQIDEMKRNRRSVEAQLAEKLQRNEEIKKRLLDLRQAQEKITRRFENAKQKKIELTATLEEKTAEIILSRQESAKLRPYVLQSPAALQTTLTELSNTLTSGKSENDMLDRRARALQTSTDTFSVVSLDVASCVKLLEDLATELTKEDEENQRLSKQRETLGERRNNIKEVERTQVLLQRQLSKWMERTSKLRNSSEEKAAIAKNRMEDLRAVHRRLTEERAGKGKEMEKRRLRIEKIEKKMSDLKESIENEIRDAHDEYLKMDSHIKLYITELEQSISI
ncbi:putative kinetochore protein NUF2 [Golovinomyces cichoracearum]|uniref:Probable kinetochore protein NUF2 n=1 Tax=Golovinomyces cichoracearum TaxID=62708 RepID=A0A420HK60_9PEZI|nr:putative kinetochore protein NUF2 [Golovinomyces cichoracearum]